MVAFLSKKYNSFLNFLALKVSNLILIPIEVLKIIDEN